MNTYTIWRGTTPVVTIDCDFLASTITSIRVCLRQGETKIVKGLADCVVEEKNVSVAFSESDVNELSDGYAEIQARITLNGGKVVPTDKVNVSVKTPIDM